MSSRYNCTACNEVFKSKTERNDHFRNSYKQGTSLTDSEGAIHQVERIDGKFPCVQCRKTFTRSDNLKMHWKTCMEKNGRESIKSLQDDD